MQEELKNQEEPLKERFEECESEEKEVNKKASFSADQFMNKEKINFENLSLE